MKQSLFMVLALALATFGAAIHPFWPVLLYYFFAILRPQFLWDWALPPGVRWSAIAAGIVLFALFTHASRIWRRLDVNIVAVLIAGYAFWVGAGLLSAFDPSVSRVYAVVYFKVALMSIIAIYVIERFTHVRLVAVMIVLSLGFIAYTENTKYFFQGRMDLYRHGLGDLDNNGAALLVVAGLPMACMFAVTAGRGIWRVLRWACVPISVMMVHLVLLSYSRGAMLAGLVGVGWVAVHHKPRRQALLAALALGLVVHVLAGQEVRERFLSTTNYAEDSSAMGRLHAWGAAWDMAWDQPMFGFGLRNSPQYIGQFSDQTVAPTVHNQYLQLAADSGIPAAAIYIVLVGACVLRLRYSRRLCEEALDDGLLSHRHKRLAEGRNLWLGFESSIVTFAVGGMFLSIELMEMPWLLMAIAAVSPRIAEAMVDRFSVVEDQGDEPRLADAETEPVERRAAA